MNLIDDVGVAKEKWFEMEGGGKVQFRIIPSSIYKEIQKKTVKKKETFKKVEGTPAHFVDEIIDTDLQNELFWDAVIVSWNDFSFRHPETKEVITCTPDTCTRENKLILINQSSKFITFANESLKALADDENQQKEDEKKTL
jgi:hypothetical protein